MFARKWGITHMLDDCVQSCFGLMHAANDSIPTKEVLSLRFAVDQDLHPEVVLMEVRRPTVSMTSPLPPKESGEFQDLFATDEDSPEDM